VADWMADSLSASEAVYSYVFDDPGAPAPEPLRAAPFPVGAGHSLELRFLFDVGGAPPLSPDQQRLSEEMIDYWSRFVTTGAPGWPAQGPGDSGERMSLQPEGNRVVANFEQEHQCPFWASLKS
jgi:para-nitrobenzyl esterase